MKVNKSKLLFESIVRLLRRGARDHIERLLIKSHPSEIAAVVRKLADEEGVFVINQIQNMEKKAETLVELEGKFLQTFLDETQDREHIAKVVQTLPMEETANLLADLEDENKEEILSLMKKSAKEDVSEILQYGEDTCGRIMAINFFAINQSKTAAEAISEIQKNKNLESVFYIYVVDDLDKLVGVVSLRQILQVKSNRKLKEFMINDVIWVDVYDSHEKAASYVEEYNFVSLPVVDEFGILQGIVMVDDVIDFIRDEAQEEALQIAGVDPEAIDDFSFWRSLGLKSIWYGLLFIGGILCSEIVLYYFSHFPEEVIFLCFAPLVLRFGGSIATQNITLLNQGILDLEIEKSRAYKTVWGQNGIALLVSVFLAAAIYGYSFFRFSQMDLSLSLSLGIIVVSIVSMVLGLLVPIIFFKMKLDSSKASSRFVHFLMDAISLFVFFQFQWFVNNMQLMSRIWT